MTTGRRIVLVLGILLALPAILLMIAGGVAGGAYAFGRGDDGYFSAELQPVRTKAVAITTTDLDFGSDPGPATVLDRLDVRFRIQAHDDRPGLVFVGIGRTADVRRYLAETRIARVHDVDGSRLRLRVRPGALSAPSPVAQRIWVRQATGRAPTVVWEPKQGHWTVVMMNVSGLPPVHATVDVGVKAGFLGPLALILLGLGVLLAVGAVLMIVLSVRGRHGPPTSTDGVVAGAPAAGRVGEAGEPVALVARLDPNVSRWQWLVKWFLAIPHFVVLLFLWAAFLLLTIVAGFAILFTGRYPRAIFEFNVGVLRWSWRVSYYAGQGGIGTDRYPPFTLADVADYPAHLDVAYPEQLSRGLVLVKWWLLAIPQYLVVAVFTGGTYARFAGFGLLTIFVIVAGASMLFRARYPRPLFDLIVGLNRWVVRVTVYAALMTDRYPPFRLDQGGIEPAVPPGPALPEGGASRGPVG